LAQIALTTCMDNYGIFNNINVGMLQTKVSLNEASGLIDKTSNMINDKVYIFAGSHDFVIRNCIS
jgi:hypothetical protein